MIKISRLITLKTPQTYIKQAVKLEGIKKQTSQAVSQWLPLDPVVSQISALSGDKMVGCIWGTMLSRIYLSLMNQHDTPCFYDLLTKAWPTYTRIHEQVWAARTRRTPQTRALSHWPFNKRSKLSLRWAADTCTHSPPHLSVWFSVSPLPLSPLCK